MTTKKKVVLTTSSKLLKLYLNRSKKRKRIQKRAKNKINRKNKITSKKKQLVIAVEGVSPLVEKAAEGVSSLVEKAIEGVSPLVEKAAEGVSSLVEKAIEGVSPLVEKYWFQRYNLFSRFDEGIRMDEEGWFSVTPEEIAIKHAGRCGGGTVIDCFAGVGGNAIQFARMCHHVVAIDIDPQKIELAINNARVYGVEDYIDFVVGDFFQLASSLKGDVAFLSPPWGGPTYSSVSSFTLDLLKPKDGYSIFQAAQKITPNIIMFLPRNVDLDQVEGLSWLSCPPLNFEVEENYVQGRLKAITAYFGNTAALPAIAS